MPPPGSAVWREVKRALPYIPLLILAVVVYSIVQGQWDDAKAGAIGAVLMLLLFGVAYSIEQMFRWAVSKLFGPKDEATRSDSTSGEPPSCT